MNDPIENIIESLARDLACNLLWAKNPNAETELVRCWLENNTQLRANIESLVAPPKPE